MHRSMVNLVHDIRVFGAHGVLRGAVRYPIRQKLVRATPGAKAGCFCCAVSSAPTHQSLTGQSYSVLYTSTHFTHVA